MKTSLLCALADSGAVMVESLIGVTLILLVGATAFDYGMLLRDKQILAQATSVAGRGAAIVGAPIDADTIRSVARSFLSEAGQTPNDYSIELRENNGLGVPNAGTFLEISIARTIPRTIWVHNFSSLSSTATVNLPLSFVPTCSNTNLALDCAAGHS